jgi:hypothetical protein
MLLFDRTTALTITIKFIKLINILLSLFILIGDTPNSYLAIA